LATLIRPVSRAARLRRRVTPRFTVSPKTPIQIDRLVSPLRYDILVRQHFFDFLSDAARLPWAELREAAYEQPYFTWFEQVMAPRFVPDASGARNRLNEAFDSRVRSAVALYNSFTERGFDARYPITLRAGVLVRPTETGKQIGVRIFAGDGCHRIALLRSTGIRTLEPSMYRVSYTLIHRPLDNTVPLLSPLNVTLDEYFAFLTLAYPREEVAGALGTDAHAANRTTPELAAIVQTDVPLLSDHRSTEMS
jgi:hypothetical protein